VLQPEAGAPGITTIGFDLSAMGRVALRHLRSLMFDQAKPGQLIKIPNQLIVRASCPATARPSTRPGRRGSRDADDRAVSMNC
jgi:hypothetical protein